MRIDLYIIIIVISMCVSPIKAQESAYRYGIPPIQQHITAPMLNLPYHNDLVLQRKKLLNIDTLLYNDSDLSLKHQMPATKNTFSWHGNIYSYDFSKSGTLSVWDNGRISGFSSNTSYPIIGNIRSAGFGISHNFTEQFNFSGNLSFNKYALPIFSYNSYALTGQFSFRFNKNLSVTAFGSYESNRFINNNKYNPPNSINTGSYLTAVTNNNEWGVDIGVQRYFNPYQRKWVTIPMLRPFYNLGGNKLGFDLGGLLYQIFHTTNLINHSDNWDVRHNNKPHNRGSRDNILLPRKH
ncbi:MAG: hypothetical protein E7080_03005 [Bacteroidales bacterium]|nr:hypothetical protein [Bacteroidales bacterium]